MGCYKLLTGNLLTGLVVIFEAHFGCHDILILGKSPQNVSSVPTTVAVDWDIKHQFKLTNSNTVQTAYNQYKT